MCLQNVYHIEIVGTTAKPAQVCLPEVQALVRVWKSRVGKCNSHLRFGGLSIYISTNLTVLRSIARVMPSVNTIISVMCKIMNVYK